MRKMGKRARVPVFLIVAVGSGGCGIRPADSAESPAAGLSGARAVEARVQELARKDLWPGFDPLAVPLAVHDGSHTWLFRHPAPPEGFLPVEGANRLEGRHPTVTTDSSARIGTVETAIVTAGTLHGSPERAAGIAVREAFRAFQLRQHPTGLAVDLEFFAYPSSDGDLLGLRRLESEALRRALATKHPAGAACWARIALDVRHERFQRMPSGAADYERRIELTEGLAFYVEQRAVAPAVPLARFPDFASDDVRLRAAPVGAAFAHLLDRFSAGWRHTLDFQASQPLDRLLAVSLPVPSRRSTCGFQPSERAGMEAAARADVARRMAAVPPGGPTYR
jgi:hypothetical protein